MSVLVTGETGLLGSRIVRDLVVNGDNVVAYDLNLDTQQIEHLLTQEQLAKVKMVEGDILDYDGLYPICEKEGVDRIIHTASMMGNADKPRLAVKINCGGIMTVLELAKNLDMKKLVWAGTNSVFDRSHPGPIPNDAPFKPFNIYGASKTFNEYAADIYYNDFGLDTTGIRIGAMVFGAGQKRGISSTMAIEALYKPAVGEPGHVIYDDAWAWIYTDDAAKAAVTALGYHRGANDPGAFNIGGPIVDFKDLIKFVKQLLPDAVIKHTAERAPLFGRGFWEMDMSVTEKVLGYRLEWDIWDAFKASINDTRRHAGLPEV